MNTKAILLSLFAILLINLTFSFNWFEDDMIKQWQEFKVTYQRSYATVQEEEYRFTVFVSNMQEAQRLNEAPGNKAVYGMTRFSDLTLEEFRSTYLNSKNTKKTIQQQRYLAWKGDQATSTPPCSISWVDKGATTPVYNQGQEGSDAYAGVEEMESMYYLNGVGPLTELSVQQVISCNPLCTGNGPCEPPQVFQYVKNNGGIESEAEYPMNSGQGCKFNKTKAIATVANWTYISQTPNNEPSMGNYTCSKGPLAVCVDAATWQNYRGGIVTSNCGTQLDHCVQAVGLNATGNPPYWIVRNQWGVTWGEQGYIYLEYGVNMCGIALEATTVFMIPV